MMQYLYNLHSFIFEGDNVEMMIIGLPSLPVLLDNMISRCQEFEGTPSTFLLGKLQSFLEAPHRVVHSAFVLQRCQAEGEF